MKYPPTCSINDSKPIKPLCGAFTEDEDRQYQNDY